MFEELFNKFKLSDKIKNTYQSIGSTTSEEEFAYAIAIAEFDEKEGSIGLMAKALSEANGDEKVQKAKFLKLRADQILSEIPIYKKELKNVINQNAPPEIKATIQQHVPPEIKTTGKVIKSKPSLDDDTIYSKPIFNQLMKKRDPAHSFLPDSSKNERYIGYVCRKRNITREQYNHENEVSEKKTEVDGFSDKDKEEVSRNNRLKIYESLFDRIYEKQRNKLSFEDFSIHFKKIEISFKYMDNKSRNSIYELYLLYFSKK